MGTEALAFHRRLTVVDGHCDIPLALNRLADARGDVPGFETTALGRALRAGGVDVVVGPVYTELEYLPDGSLRRALQGFIRTSRAVATSPEFAVASTGAELRRVVADGKTALILGLEGCTPLGYDPDLLQVFVQMGARVVGLTWNERNAFASGAKQRNDEGLSRLGKALVREGDRLGVIFDVSHLNERSFWDLMETSTGPVVASHSNCHALYAHDRNLRDDQMRVLADRGGIVSLMIQSFALSPKVATLDDVLRHVDHAVSVVGIDHVGFGYDFIEFVDGLDLMKMDYLPPAGPPEENLHKTVTEIPTHAELPALTQALLAHGYGEGDVERLMGGNWLRFLTSALR